MNRLLLNDFLKNTKKNNRGKLEGANQIVA